MPPQSRQFFIVPDYSAVRRDWQSGITEAVMGDEGTEEYSKSCNVIRPVFVAGRECARVTLA